jgi:SAM-dependent methyltransferase
MIIEHIEKNWDIAIVDTDAAKRLWGLYSQTEKSLPPLSPETNLPLKIVADNQMVNAQSDILDIGCGSGRFSLYFAERCHSVVGLDFSSEMIEKASAAAAEKKLSNTNFVLENWHEMDLDRYGWKGRFDLVFANMSPAIQSARTLSMMNEASRGWCFMAKPTHREDKLVRYLLNELGVDWYHRPFEIDMVYAYDWLYLKGYLPKVDYKQDKWQRILSMESAVPYYTEWVGMNYPLNERQKAGIGPLLEKIAQDGKIIDGSAVTISMLYWHV